jgi:hypothetical protein
MPISSAGTSAAFALVAVLSPLTPTPVDALSSALEGFAGKDRKNLLFRSVESALQALRFFRYIAVL